MQGLIIRKSWDGGPPVATPSTPSRDTCTPQQTLTPDPWSLPLPPPVFQRVVGRARGFQRVEIALEDHGGGYGVYLLAGFPGGHTRFLEDALGFHRGQSLVPVFYGEPGGFPESFTKFVCTGRHG